MKSVYAGGEKVAEFENYNELRLGENKPAFIYEGNELVYPNPVKDGLVLWYDFSGRTNDDAERGVAEDLSGNGNHGTLQNFNYTSESGYDKNKLLFDGVDDYIISQNTKKVDFLKDVTIEMVFRLDAIGAFHRLLDKHWEYMSLAIWSTGAINFNSYSLDIRNNFSETRLKEDRVYHLTVSYEENKSIISMHINGVLDSAIQNSGQLEGNEEALYIGARSGLTQLHEGDIYSTKIYNRALSPEEIAHNYAIEKERFGIE